MDKEKLLWSQINLKMTREDYEELNNLIERKGLKKYIFYQRAIKDYVEKLKKEEN